LVIIEVIIGIPLLLIGSFVGYIILCVVALIISSLFVMKDKFYPKDSKYYRFVLNSGTGMSMFLSNVHVKMLGKDKLPKDEKFLLVSNHTSNWDPILTWNELKDNKISFISKPENFRIPFFGWIARRCCFMSIDRKSARNALSTYKNAEDLLINNEVNVGVYPEGTRNKNGELGTFHNSVFKIAQEANVPIVVMTVKNANKIAKNAPFKRTNVTLTVCGVLSPSEIHDVKTCEIGDKVRKLMEEALI